MNRSAEQANLFLSNRYCLSGAVRLDSTFRINFKELLGDMYYKYDKFIMVLNGYQAYTQNNIPLQQAIGTLRLVGLNWCNSSYGTNTTIYPDVVPGINNVSSFGNNAEAVCPNMLSYYPIGGGSYMFSNSLTGNTAGLVFYKPTGEYTDLRVFYRDLKTNNTTASQPDNMAFSANYSFTIYGLYD